MARATPPSSSPSEPPLRPGIDHCAIVGTLDALGDSWSILVLRQLFFGVHRFNDIQDDLGISRSVLTDRLARLVDLGVVRTRSYQEPGERRRNEYRLTRKGVALLPAIIALKEWGEMHLDAVEPVRLVDRQTGEDVRLEMRTPSGRLVAAHEMETRRD